jgi:hypothetical protein
MPDALQSYSRRSFDDKLSSIPTEIGADAQE